ncbi:MAG: hypothetical protein WBN75_21520 [Verrucomicrobiia bacterium]|jgi:hypothetical protein
MAGYGGNSGVPNGGSESGLGRTSKRLRKLGFTETKAHASAWNGRGPWWNAGASHLNAAFGAGYYQQLGLVSLLTEVQWFSMKASL